MCLHSYRLRMPAWLPDDSATSVRQALVVGRPELADLPIVIHPKITCGNPFWRRGTAVVGGDWIVKFPYSKAGRERLEQELRVLNALTASSVPVPEPVETTGGVPLIVYRMVIGEPLTGESIGTYGSAQKAQLADSLATALAALHAPDVAATMQDAGVVLPSPVAQATTDELRLRLCPMLDDGRRRRVLRWCDWIDETLWAQVPGVVLHGDLHGYNLVVDQSPAVTVLLDVETASFGDRHFDFRYLPGQERTLELFHQTAGRYAQLVGDPLDVDRVFAWHVLTVLGDALWRTEGSVSLPDGGTKEGWIDRLDTVSVALGTHRRR